MNKASQIQMQIKGVDTRESRFRQFLDLAALIAPLACLIHCIATPLVLILLPLAGKTCVPATGCEQLLTLAASIICLVAILPGYRQHRQNTIILLTAAGLALLFTGSFLATDFLGGSLELPVTVSGSIVLIIALLKNRSLSETISQRISSSGRSCRARAKTP